MLPVHELSTNCLEPGARVLEAVAVLETSDQRICLVVDPAGRLLGTVTDGDIRRGLLRGIGLDDRLDAVMNRQPLTAPASSADEALARAMRQRGVLYIPLLDEQGRLAGLESLQRIAGLRPGHDNLVVIMAGGRGTRLLPLTEGLPKPMIEVGGKPMLQIILERFARSGFSRFRIAVNYLGEAIEGHFGDGSRFGWEIRYLREQEPLGTAGALSLLEERPQAPLFVVNGDVLSRVDVEQMLRFHHEQRAEATLGVSEFDLQVPYGVVELEGSSLLRIVEKPVHRFFVNAGLYLFDPAVLSELPRGRHLDVPQLVNRLREQGRNVSVFPIHELWLDVGRHSDLERARLIFPGE